MKNIVAKVLGTVTYMVADLGVMTLLIKGFGELWQRFELTEDYVENHPTLALVRILARLFITMGFVTFICIAPIGYVINIIWTWCDNTFGEQPDLEVKDWD